MADLVLRLPAPRRVVDLVDVDSAKWAERWRASRNPVYWLESRRVRAVELRALRQLDGVTVVSRREADRLGGEGGKLAVVPMGVDLGEFAPREGDPGGARIGFVGAMDYAPNSEGALWFAREVLPLVRARRPDAVFVVIGRNPPEELARLPGVTTTGWVDDVRPVLSACAVGVTPILTSHGVQTKALVAMALGLPQVVAAQAVPGLEAVAGRDVLVGSDAREFAEAVLRLLDNPAERARLSGSGRAFAEARCDWSRILAPLEERLLPGAAPRPEPALASASAQTTRRSAP
jgi:polysaccharide biosynthesis protein PslH